MSRNSGNSAIRRGHAPLTNLGASRLQANRGCALAWRRAEDRRPRFARCSIAALQILLARRGVARLRARGAASAACRAVRRTAQRRAPTGGRSRRAARRRSRSLWPTRCSASAPDCRQTPGGRSPGCAQPAGASRALTTRAARRQSSSNASIVRAMATSEPSRSFPMQPASSHLMPLPSAASFGVRASPSAASHSRNANMSLPDLIMASRPSAPRTATALPSAAISTSGCGARTIRTIAPAISTRADQAQRRPEQAEQHQPERAHEQRPGAERRHAPDRARKARDPERDRWSSTRCPSPISHQKKPSRPNGIASSAEDAGRHDPGRHHRHRQQIREHAIGRDAVEVIGHVGHGGGAGEQRDDDQADDLAARPTARCARRAVCRAPWLIQGRPC